MTPPRKQDEDLARYIILWLCERNGFELKPAIESMRVSDYWNMHEELALILLHGGRPPNWLPLPSERQEKPFGCSSDCHAPGCGGGCSQ